MNGIVIRLAGVPNPETKVFRQETITIGTDEKCDVLITPEVTLIAPLRNSNGDEAEPLPLPALAAQSTLLTLKLVDGTYRVAALGNWPHEACIHSHRLLRLATHGERAGG